MTYPYDNEEPEEPGFFKRHRFVIGVVVLILVGVVVFAGKQLFSGEGSGPRKAPEFTMVKLPPLPPPPPPPPQPKPPEQKIEQKMIEQTPVEENEEKPDDKPKEEPPAAVSTNIAGNGPGDAFGLAGGRGGNNFLGGSSGRGGKGSRWGWYAGQVQTTIADALRKNPRTHSAAISVQVRIWPDAAGKIARVQLVGSTGDPAVDSTLKSEVLAGLRLQEPPPTGMPMPINLRLTARRPN